MSLNNIFAQFWLRLITRIKSFLTKVISREVWTVLKSILPTWIFHANLGKIFVKEWQTARKNHPWTLGFNKFRSGINLIGYLQAAKGISEAARSNLLALMAAKIPFSAIDYEFDIPTYQQTESLPEWLPMDGFKFNTNLVHINPPQLPHLWRAFRGSDLTGRYCIGVWYWELPNFPQEWNFAFGLVDEVWVASQFILNCVSASSPVPVIKIPPCIDPAYNHRLKRLDYNLPDNRFLFMCAYDVFSIQARKNPLGAVEAFKRAFAKNDTSVGLVIKVNNAAENPQEIRKLYAHVNGYSNCYIIEDVFDKPKFNSLLNLIDAYISLHRSEGFGLIPAEAMGFGKPVVMTKWSGNIDFMTDDNSCGVDYKLIPVSKLFGPYAPGQFWADPDINQAAYFMQKLYSDKKFYSLISVQAKKTIHDNFSPSSIGKLIKDRMEQIGLIS